jgi:hypothetical protein
MYGYGFRPNNKMFGGGVASYTTRTTAFATATGITDATILGALNTFDLGLISNSLDSKMKAVYPMVGGTSTTCKYNFMDARDLDVAFRLQFFGGGTFSANGYKPNGTNAYANTFISPISHLTLNSSHIAYYSRTNSNGVEIEIGTSQIGRASLLEIRTSGTTYFGINQTGSFLNTSDANSLGFYIANRTSSTVLNGWKNSTKIANSSTSSSTLASTNLYIGAYNQDFGAIYYSTKQCAFSSIGSGLTDGEAVIFYNLVQTMQTTLARQV